MTIRQLLARACEKRGSTATGVWVERPAGSPASGMEPESATSSQTRLEAEILLVHALDVSRSFLFANPELEVPLSRRNAFFGLLRRRARGEPIAYLT